MFLLKKRKYFPRICFPKRLFFFAFKFFFSISIFSIYFPCPSTFRTYLQSNRRRIVFLFFYSVINTRSSIFSCFLSSYFSHNHSSFSTFPEAIEFSFHIHPIFRSLRLSHFFSPKADPRTDYALKIDFCRKETNHIKRNERRKCWSHYFLFLHVDWRPFKDTWMHFSWKEWKVRTGMRKHYPLYPSWDEIFVHENGIKICFKLVSDRGNWDSFARKRIESSSLVEILSDLTFAWVINDLRFCLSIDSFQK